MAIIIYLVTVLMERTTSEHQRVPVRRGMEHSHRANGPFGSRPVVNDDRLFCYGGECLREVSPVDVNGTPRSERNDEGNCSVREGLRRTGSGERPGEDPRG